MAESFGVFAEQPLATDTGLAALHRRWSVDGIVPDGPDAAQALEVIADGTSRVSLAPGFALVGGWFYRTDTSRNREHGGAGLGLALCQRIAQAHQGTLGFDHSVLGGLRVTFSMQRETP